MHRVRITVDIDWAPDWAIMRLAADLSDAGVPSTWFVTHDTPVLADLRSLGSLVELGIHPNFLSGSNHGSSPSEVLAEVMRIVPEAVSMRTHCLVQSTPILQTVVNETPIRVDTSVYLRNARDVRPSELPLENGTLSRVPYVWEDDLEFFAADPLWDGREFLRSRARSDELTIIDIHPIHYVMNADGIERYRTLKSRVGHTPLITAADVADHRNAGKGTATFVSELIETATAANVDFASRLGSYAVR